jgi:xylulokinase
VGNGIVRQGVISVTTGTSGVVFAHMDEPRMDPKLRTHTFCHAVPGKWHAMGVMLSAGGSLRWFRDALGQQEVAAASAEGIDPYELLTREAAQAPPGCEGLIFLPYLTGERTPYPDPWARGVYFGLTLRHGRPHLVRAILEGVSYGLRDSLEIVREMALPISQGGAPPAVRASGGGARSALWRQIQADVFDAEIVTINVDEGPAFGAALLAGVGAGVFPSVEEACDRTISIAQRTHPNPDNSALYNTYYPLYQALYASLKDHFAELGRLALAAELP